MTDLTKFLDRKSLLADRTEVTDEVLECLYEFSEEDVNLDSLEKFTEKKFKELSEEEKTELVKNLENADYKKYKNCYISTSKLLFEKAETLVKEIKALNVLNGLGYSVYLLPFGYARNNQNFLQKSADSITNHQFLEFKNVVSVGLTAGESAYKDGRKRIEGVNNSPVVELFNEKSYLFPVKKIACLNDFVNYETEPERESSAFDDELGKFADGKIAGNHIFNLGKPGEILQKCGFPKDRRIELSSSRLMMKAAQGNHPFDIKDVKGLDKAIQNPVAVFEYGNKEKSQNVIVELQKDGKNFLVGVFFNQKQRGYEVSDIRGLFNRDNIDWIRWIEQGKMIYGNKERIQVLAAQQRTNLAEVNRKEARTSSDSYYLDSADSIMQKFGDVKDIYTEDFEFYKENKERYKIFKAFRNIYQELEAIETADVPMMAKEFYEALKNNDAKTLLKYTGGEMYPEIAEKSDELVCSFNLEHNCTQKFYGNALKNTRELNDNSQVEERFSNKHPLPSNNIVHYYDSVNKQNCQNDKSSVWESYVSLVKIFLSKEDVNDKKKILEASKLALAFQSRDAGEVVSKEFEKRGVKDEDTLVKAIRGAAYPELLKKKDKGIGIER